MEYEKKRNQEDKKPNSIILKYVKFGYHYLISNAMYLFLVPLSTTALAHLSKDDFVHFSDHVMHNLVVVTLCVVIIAILATLHFLSRPRKVYLVNFSCYKPDHTLMCSNETFMKATKLTGSFTEESLAFQKKILERSGYGQKTYTAKTFLEVPINMSFNEARKEAEMVMFGVIDELLAKTGVKTKDIRILVVNCSLFNPAPSLSAMVVNRYKLRGNILSYNLSGMGCSAGLISIDLAKRLLQIRPNSYALVVSMESLTLAGYDGNTRSMLIPNCLFRMGAAAILLTNRSSDRHCSKYQLVHALRTHKGADDRGYNCVFQKEDINNRLGVALSKDLLPVAGEGGRAVLDELEKSLGLSEWHMEPSRMTLYRFGNTSSSSLWYELAYTEAKGRIKKGDRAWQIAFGSGFKCNSVVWRALRTINSADEKHNPWIDEIDSFPVHVPEVAPIDC
ncbi:3-ketoacyl-CoA synthase 20-like isoform X2 [Castanea sativa]|uniref:3-ketoacyl-CoA synthase 20-like isoform X2 n=1 Tax=Castanea sativa TaxID=21020 RepID=UPI003F64F160